MAFVRYEINTDPAIGYVKDGQVFRVPFERLSDALLAPEPSVSGGGEPLDKVKLLPSLDPDAKILCVALNYVNHAKEANQAIPESPILFFKSQEAMIAGDADIVTPDIVTQLDYEGELAVTIGKEAYNITPADAWGYIAGVACFNDVSATRSVDGQGRAKKKRISTGFRENASKRRRRWAPRWCRSAEVIDGLKARTVRVMTKVNGEVRQDSPIADMIFDIPTIVAFAASRVRLRPGDVIATGTPPGVGFADGRYLAKGDVVEVEITGLPGLKSLIA